MRKRLVCLAIGTCVLATAVAHAVDREAFEANCQKTSLNDGLETAAAEAFCSCLADAAIQDEDLYNELAQAGETEPDLDKRLAMLSERARAAAQSCQG